MKIIRQSNIELLRVVSMLLIMIVHTCYMGIDHWYNTPSYRIENFCRFLIEAIAIVGVNCFILISGFFGIRLSTKRVVNIVFQTYFVALLSLLVCIGMFGIVGLQSSTIIKCLFPVTHFIWFIPSYLLLMLFSPMLNAWLEKSESKSIILWTSLVYCITYYWQVCWHLSLGFGGYSFGFFMVLYIIGHLLRRYDDRQKTNKWCWFAGYALCIMMLMVISYAQRYFPYFKSLLWSYDCPIVLLESICFFMFFANIDIGHIKWINWIGRSCFAILLLHISPCSTYVKWLTDVNNLYSGITLICLTLLIITSYYLMALVIDQVRIQIWQRWVAPLFKN